MRRLKALAAVLLTTSLAAEPAFAAGRFVAASAPVQAPTAIGPLAVPAAALGTGGISLTAPTLDGFGSLPTLAPGLALPSAVAPPTVAAVPSIGAARVNRADAPDPKNSGPSTPERKALRKKLSAIGRAVEAAGKGSEEASSEQQAEAGRKQFDALGAEESDGDGFEAMLERNLDAWESGRLNPAGSVSAEDLLAEEAPRVSRAVIRKVEQDDAALQDGVVRAVSEVFPGETIRVVSRGSSSRGTFEDENPDHDLMVELPASWSLAKVDSEMSARLPALRDALSRAVSERVAALGYGEGLRVQVGGTVQLADPATRAVDEGVFMLPVQVFDGDHRRLLDADVTFTNREKYTNPYPEYFARQIEQVAAAGGAEAVERALWSIRLAKRFFKRVVGAYKVWRGGPSGVGVEQMILQSGGDFDGFIDRIHDAAFDENGAARAPKEAKGAWTVHNPFREPANFVEHIGDKAWKRLAAAAREYRRAKASGRTTNFDALARASSSAPARKTEAEMPLRRTVRVKARFTLDADRRGADRALRDMVRELEEGGERVLDANPIQAGNRARGPRDYAVDLLVQTEASGAEVVSRVRDAFGPTAAAVDLDADSREVVLFLRRTAAMKMPEQRAQFEKSLKSLGRRLSGRARVSSPSRGSGKDEAVVRLRLETGADAVEAAEDADKFLKTRGGIKVSAVSVPNAETAAETTGALTVEMLDRFTETGPRPVERGDAFLYAQGAKALPEGLESSWEGSRREAKGDSVQRLLLRRRNGRTEVLVPSFNNGGRPFMKAVRVPDGLGDGIVTNTLVEAGFLGRDIVSIESIGAYPMDVMIGRVVNTREGLALESLFSENKKAKALYARLPFSGEAREGDLVQAFVSPDGKGYRASGLMNLGRNLTPEIAAREIALRHGARAYFDEAVIRQAEEVGRTQDPKADFDRIAAKMSAEAPELKVSDMSDKAFVTIDPIGAGDLDDAFYAEKHEDGSYTWYLATADVGHYVAPGSPAFRAAALIGNTFYSVDKNGVGEYPMNHPVVSKYVSSLLAGKKSLAMITKMRFTRDGEFLPDESEVSFGLVEVQGRYTYEQAVELWKGNPEHGIGHTEQVAIARELARKLDTQDAVRGKLALEFEEVAHRPNADGTWSSRVVEEDPLLSESHKLIEELKVYGNRGIASVLEKIKTEYGVPHISRVHPHQTEAVNKRLREELSRLGVPWPKNETLWDYLRRLNSREDLTREGREAAQILALRTRRPAEYAMEDGEGHEGLALEAGQYDHPSTPIRRFADMYNRSLLEAYLSGGNPRQVYAAVEKDLRAMGFRGLEEYMQHLNGREQASKAMDREMDNFMAVYELAKPERKGKTYKGFIEVVVEGNFPIAVIQLTDIPVSFTVTGEDAANFKVMDGVAVTVNGADVAKLKVDAKIQRDGKRPVLSKK
ncbi:MAG: hypothetical protein CO113_13235, partial [Elusimicrobia bacterium CG_4_9_14_3_um_filter_62_55]